MTEDYSAVNLPRQALGSKHAGAAPCPVPCPVWRGRKRALAWHGAPIDKAPVLGSGDVPKCGVSVKIDDSVHATIGRHDLDPSHDVLCGHSIVVCASSARPT